MKNDRGFTLIEILIAVAILGIIAAVAIPSFSAYAMQARRTEAITLLNEVTGEQYRYFSENNKYAAKLSDLGYSTDIIDTENGNYTVSLSASSDSSYTATATPKTGSVQTGDAHCTSFSINSIGTKTVTPAGNEADCW